MLSYTPLKITTICITHLYSPKRHACFVQIQNLLLNAKKNRRDDVTIHVQFSIFCSFFGKWRDDPGCRLMSIKDFPPIKTYNLKLDKLRAQNVSLWYLVPTRCLAVSDTPNLLQLRYREEININIFNFSSSMVCRNMFIEWVILGITPAMRLAIGRAQYLIPGIL